MYFPKWDTTNGYLPYRYFISFFLENDQMPYWNPFQRMGYPGYADLQSGCWYPITRIIMLFGQYDIVSVTIELLSCFVIAALGMFRLSMHIHNHEKTAFLLGLAYALSGFMTGSTHLMVFLIGVAWLPWIIWSMLAFLQAYQWKYGVYLAGFMAMNITGASPAYTILMVYIMVGMLIWHLFKLNFSGAVIRSILRGAWPAILLLALLTAPYVVSFFEFLPYFNRAHQRPYEDMVINPLVPGNWLSLIYAYTINDRHHEWFKLTDLSLRDTYIGIFLVPMIILGLMRDWKKSMFISLVVCALISFLAALGDETFIYQYLFKLPGFGLFRHPSFLRSYGIFCLILLAGYRLKDILDGVRLDAKERYVMGAFLLMFVGFTVWAASGSSLELLKKAVEEIFSMEELPSTGMSTLLWLNGMVIIALLVLVVVLRRITGMSMFFAIAIFCTADLALHIRYTGPTTMYHTYSFSKMKQFFDELPAEISQVDPQIPMSAMTDLRDIRLTDGIQVNYATFFKHICIDGENPLRMKNFDDAKTSGALTWNQRFPLAFITNELWHEGMNAPDTTVSTGKITGIDVGFNKFTIDFQNEVDHESWICLNQNYHGQWSARLGEINLPVEKVNGMIMGVRVPGKSKGKIEFSYRSAWIPTLQRAAMSGWIFWMVFLGLSGIKKSRKV